MAVFKTAELTDNISKLLVAASLGAGLLSLLFSWWFWARFHIDIPVEDNLRLLPMMQSLIEDGWNSVTIEEWLAPHAYAHRIAVGRLLMAIEYKYLSGGNSLFYLGCWLSIGVLVYLYYKVARDSGTENSHPGVFMLGLALIYAFSYTQTYNLTMPINSLWYISAACSALSLYLLLFPDRNLTLSRAIGSCLLAMVAAYSVFSGIICCLIVAILALRCRSVHAIWVPILMLAFTFVYVQEVKSGQELVLEKISNKSADVTLAMHVQTLIENRGKLFHYTVVFLSSPLSTSPSLLSYVYVIPSILLILYGCTRLARHWYQGKAPTSEAATFYLAMSTLFLCTALACFLGRSFLNAPTAPRYQTTVMLYWLSISGLLLYSLPEKVDSRIRTATMLMLLLIPAGLLYTQSEFKLLSVVNRMNLANDTEASTRLGCPNFRDPRFPGDKYTPEYVRFESFLASNTLLRAGINSETTSASEAPNACNGMRIQFQPRSVDENQCSVATLTVTGNRLQRFRRIHMAGPDAGYGYLYAIPRESVSFPELLWVATAWKGYYRGRLDVPHFDLKFESILGSNVSCRLPLPTR